jgi:hypothetical protein
MARESLPAYSQLPAANGAPPGSSWGLWGEGDVFGCLNLIDDEARRRGTDAIVTREVFSLNLSLAEPNPPMFGRPAFEHKVTWLPNESGHDDALDNWNTQASSQWDGFRHIKHPVHGFYNAVADEDHGIGHWAERGIVTRAVLCDLGRYLEGEGRPIDYAAAQPIPVSDVLGALERQGSVVEPGDILLIRTGWVEWYLAQGEAMRKELAEETRAPGLAPGRDTVAALWDLHVAAVAADNPAVEVFPATGHMGTDRIMALIGEGRFEEFFAHFALIPLLGLPLGEFFVLGPLAAACARDRRYTSLLTSAPINLPRGVASPPNAIAIR